jgi:hypothetical protein
MLFIPVAPRPQRPEHPELRGLPVRFAPDVEIKEWREQVEGGFGILHKEYSTPGGKLTTSVRLSADWPHGDHIPFVDDYQVPRSLKPLITGPEELEALRYLLTPPRAEDVAQFEREAQEAHAFVREHGVLLAGGWGVGEVVLSAPVDLYIRRAWYEGCDFVTPWFFHPSTTSPSTPRAPGTTLRLSRMSGTSIGDRGPKAAEWRPCRET